MSQWLFVRRNKNEMSLMTGSQPINVTMSPKCRYDPASLFKIVDLMNVPPSYTWGLEEIRFTRLRSLHGTFDPELNAINLSTDLSSLDLIHRFFVHELAHHVDERENLSKNLEKELSLTQDLIAIHWIKESVEEYFAAGLEVFYCGWEHEKESLEKNHPELHSTILKVHKRHRKMSLR